MTQTKVFDEVVKHYNGEFSLNSLINTLMNNQEWVKDKQYIKDCLSDRIKKQKIIKLENGNYLSNYQEINTINRNEIINAIPVIAETRYNKRGLPILKYPTVIGMTYELQNMLNNGLDRYQESNLIKLSTANSNFIENEINNSDVYKFNFAKIVFDHYNDENGFIRTRDAYFAVLRMIDNDNSTSVWKNSRRDFYSIIDFIMNNENEFYERLSRCDISLVDDILSVCSKDLLSFASKICKYLNLWLFNNENGFFIYDYYVKESLPYYLDYYKNNLDSLFSTTINIKNYKKRNYRDFNDLMNALLTFRNNEFGDVITKDKLDHIMWYSYHRFAQQ